MGFTMGVAMVVLVGVQGMERPHGNVIHHSLLGNVKLRQMALMLSRPRFSHDKFIERPPLGPLLVGSFDPCGRWMVRALHHVPDLVCFAWPPFGHVIFSHFSIFGFFKIIFQTFFFKKFSGF